MDIGHNKEKRLSGRFPSRFEKESSFLQKLFATSDSQTVLEVINCSLSGKSKLSDILSQGALYVTAQNLFYVSGKQDLKECIPLKNVYKISKKRSGLIDNAIAIFEHERKFLFVGVNSRDKAFDLLKIVWDQCNVDRDQDWVLEVAKGKNVCETTLLKNQFSGVSDHEVVLEYFECSLDGAATEGHLYITNCFTIYFYSKAAFANEVKAEILISSMSNIEKSSGIFSAPAIDITTSSRKFSLKNFVGTQQRDQCYDYLVSLKQQYSKRTKVFGTSLGQLLAKESAQMTPGIPACVELLIQQIIRKGLDVEGIFRIPANKTEVDRYADLLDAGKDPKEIIEGIQDVHASCALLKKFFRDLPEPLLTSDLYDCFIVLYESKHLVDEPEFQRKLRDLVKLLPPRNKIITQFVLNFLSFVSTHQETNKMSIKNLAIVWGPVMLRTPEIELNAESLREAGYVCSLIGMLIEHKDHVF
eukprot:TRINITY_DN1437_c0_g1_i2.p1 TRINITY_DN1437_c0_g1~~TRINITY_DN1437_c0_g1_i2.p1  ORF type:complete len:472 (-),score=118.95 TRINITY_DN1437_c0_g1_i2:1285-2700(-)